MDEHYTDLDMNTFELKWEIRKFIAYVKESEKRQSKIELESPPFSVQIGDKDTKWYLKFVADHSDNSDYLNNSSQSNHSSQSSGSSNLSYSSDSNTMADTTTIAFYVVSRNDKDKSRYRAIIESHFITEKKGRFGDHCEFHKIAHKKPIQFYSNHRKDFLTTGDIKTLCDHLRIICQIYIIGDTVTSSGNYFIPKIIGKNLPNNLVDLLENEKLTDVTFVLGNKRIKAHKVILAGHSPVFAAIFDNPMMEQRDSAVAITDIDVDTFKKMLRYIYTNEVPDLENAATSLLYAADKYALESLKELCGVSIWKEITVDNAIEALIFADRHDLKQFVVMIRNFIKLHILDVMETTGFKNMERELPELANTILRHTLKKHKFVTED